MSTLVSNFNNFSVLVLLAASVAGCGTTSTNTKETTTMQTQTDNSKAPSTKAPTITAPVVAAVVNHRVTDFDTWKAAFDAHAGARAEAGIVSSHINRSVDDPNQLSVYLAGSDAAKFEAFFTSPELKSAMSEAGVEGPPTITMLRPIEDHSQKRDPLFGMIVVHPVADYAAWKKVYDEVAGLRQERGIVGAAVNQALGDANLVIVYHQAESLEALQGFVGSDELKEAMGRAGVSAPPKIMFFEGAGWAAN